MDESRGVAGPFAPGDLVRVLPSASQRGYVGILITSRGVDEAQILQYDLKRTRFCTVDRLAKPTAYQRDRYAKWFRARDWRRAGKRAG